MTELYLGDNLNRAMVRDEGGTLLVLDGRERENPAAKPRVANGTYRVTRTSGSAPGEVAYYGHAA